MLRGTSVLTVEKHFWLPVYLRAARVSLQSLQVGLLLSNLGLVLLAGLFAHRLKLIVVSHRLLALSFIDRLNFLKLG